MPPQGSLEGSKTEMAILSVNPVVWLPVTVSYRNDHSILEHLSGRLRLIPLPPSCVDLKWTRLVGHTCDGRWPNRLQIIVSLLEEEGAQETLRTHDVQYEHIILIGSVENSAWG